MLLDKNNETINESTESNNKIGFYCIAFPNFHFIFLLYSSQNLSFVQFKYFYIININFKKHFILKSNTFHAFDYQLYGENGL